MDEYAPDDMLISDTSFHEAKICYFLITKVNFTFIIFPGCKNYENKKRVIVCNIFPVKLLF